MNDENNNENMKEKRYKEKIMADGQRTKSFQTRQINHDDNGGC